MKTIKECFQDTENVFNDIVVNKLKTVDPTYLSKLFYLLNLGIYLYHKKNSHISNLKLIIKNKIKNMMSFIPLSLSTKKSDLQILHVTFYKYILYFFKSQK